VTSAVSVQLSIKYDGAVSSMEALIHEHFELESHSIGDIEPVELAMQ